MLARLRKAHEENDEGFTLIELLVVMIIIGILAAIAIPTFLNQRKKAVDSSMKSDLKTAATAAETYFVENNSYNALNGTNAATGPLGVEVSDGNVLNITATVDDYCIVASRDTGATSSTQNWVYDSDAGGLQPSTVTSC
ncbi:MAG: prepilin-type cleavage/methylation domain-containing protein [Micrococcales bacterium]|nr:MAG: prepilin-type cleavage/methylation domain-containing protein [Micrococcales bacterium]PIE26747.1 MAG: prepilin-type cleavage/methylation domain-containing protein [Micrococcales bacterium]